MSSGQFGGTGLGANNHFAGVWRPQFRQQHQRGEEEVVEETMAVDPAMDAEAILAIVKPAIDAEVNNIVAMIADLKAQLEEALAVDSEEDVVEEVVALSAQQKLSNFIKFNNK